MVRTPAAFALSPASNDQFRQARVYSLSQIFERRLQALQQAEHHHCLRQIRHGIEKEGLRVTKNSHLPQTCHPEHAGAPLTHPYITTDYSEALLEFITPACQDIGATFSFLEELHGFTLKKMNPAENIWGSSMPPVLEGDERIPVAWYGTSNIGQMKHVYRQGLAHRYGKSMQTIAGIHYNFSLPGTFWSLMKTLANDSRELIDYQSEGYLALIRNFRRYSWLLMYLFGASPAMNRCFLDQHPDTSLQLESAGDSTRLMPWATSLRMSDLGYNNKAQSSLNICYNKLNNYVEGLWQAVHMPCTAYERIGLRKNGEYLQLNTNLLQIENEYYSPIRPKRATLSGEKPVVALRERGVEYIEVRCLDLNPFLPVGIDAIQAHFLDVFLVFCALRESPAIEETEGKAIARNFEKTVNEGRRPGLMLKQPEQGITLVEWGLELLDQLSPIATLMDGVHGTDDFSMSLHQQRRKLTDSEHTPSAQVLNALSRHNHSFIEMSQELARIHSDYFRQIPLSQSRMEYFSELARQSLHEQQAIEAADAIDFDTFLMQYFAD